jgi:hypothetical protein
VVPAFKQHRGRAAGSGLRARLATLDSARFDVPVVQGGPIWGSQHAE